MQAGALRVNEAGSAFEHTIRIAYRPSPRALTLFTAMHLGALPPVVLCGLPLSVKFCIAALVTVSLAVQSRQWRRALRDPAPSILQLNARDEWRLERRGVSARMTAGADSVVLPGLILLHLRDEARASRFFILAPDNTPADVLRRLGVRLRFPISAAD